MQKPTILFLFNCTGYAVEPWLRGGKFNCVSVDYDYSDDNPVQVRGADWLHLNMDLSWPGSATSVKNKLRNLDIPPPALVISFAPCTDLAVSGAKHFKRKLREDPDCQARAVRMARLAEQFDCAYMVENPVSALATLWRKPDFYWHPWEFGLYLRWAEGEHPEFPDIIPWRDLYNKKSCLWTGNGFILPIKWHGGAPDKGANPGWEKLGGKSARTKYIRSLTPRGFAQAVYAANHRKILAQEPEQLNLFT